MAHNTLNTSVSKHLHSFPKSSRFPTHNSPTFGASSKTYNKLSDFDKTVNKGKGKAEFDFGERHRRFSYYPGGRDSMVGPANYKQ
jgi:hypothetical protein